MNFKKASLGLLCCLSSLALFGCGETSETTNQSLESVQSTPQTKTYKISFDTDGGSSVNPIVAEAGSSVAAPTNPTKTGYSFVGWFSDDKFNNSYTFSTMPSSDIVLYAKWSIQTYTITYFLDGGANNPNNPSSYNILKKDIKLADPTKDNLYFAGWYLEETFVTKITTIKTESAMNYNLYAKWTEGEPIVNYNIIYNLDGGTNHQNNPATFNSTMQSFRLEDPTRADFDFIGWYTDANFVNPISVINTSSTQDIEVFAKWDSRANTYLVTYNLDGGNNHPDNLSRYKDVTESFKLKPATRASSMFVGWFTDPEFTEPITEIDTSKKQNYTLYAKFLSGMNEVVHTLDLGIGKEHTIYHISDAHIVAGTSANQRKREQEEVTSWRLGFAVSFKEVYDEKYLPTSSTGGLQSMVDYLETQKPDAFAFSGDLVDSADTASVNWISNFLDGLNTPFVYALGNHEAPHSTFPIMRGMDTHEFTVLEFEDFEIIALDNAISRGSNNNQYYFTSNQYTKLSAECNKGKPIIIVEHVPLITSYNSGSRIAACGDTFYIDHSNTDSTTKNVINLMLENENIKLILCGHIHGGVRADVSARLPQITASSSLMGNYNKIIIK